MFKNVSLVVLVVLLLLACLMEPLVAGRIGGTQTIMLGVVICLIIAYYTRDDVPFPQAVKQVVQANKGLLFLLIWYYLWVTIGYFRDIESVPFVEVKYHLTFIFSLCLGFFLTVNKKYTRLLILTMIPFMLYHALRAKRYVDMTGYDLRAALIDEEGKLGHTYYWTAFAMLVLTLVGYLLNEKNKIIKIIGALCLLPCYYALLICGFATPVALGVVGHLLVGWAYFKFSRKNNALFLTRLLVLAGIVTSTALTVYVLSKAENNPRLYNISYRIQRMLEDPRGGGYDRNESRFNLIFISLDTFKENPLFGSGGGYLANPKTGGHQALFDYLALYGIMGGGAFILFVFLCLRNAGLRCKQEQDWASYGRFAAVGVYVIVGIVNPSWMGPAAVPFFLLGQPFKLPKPHPVLNPPKMRAQMYDPTRHSRHQKVLNPPEFDVQAHRRRNLRNPL